MRTWWAPGKSSMKALEIIYFNLRKLVFKVESNWFKINKPPASKCSNNGSLLFGGLEKKDGSLPDRLPQLPVPFPIFFYSNLSMETIGQMRNSIV